MPYDYVKYKQKVCITIGYYLSIECNDLILIRGDLGNHRIGTRPQQKCAHSVKTHKLDTNTIYNDNYFQNK